MLIAFLVSASVGCDAKKKTDAEHQPAAEQHVETRWKCSRCNEWHDELPFTYGPRFPDPYLSVPEKQREARVKITPDFCVIDAKQFFVRGRLEIPVAATREPFAWDVWVSLSERDFYRTGELLEREGRESEEPYIGWLCTDIHLYPDTSNLEVRVHTQPVGIAPKIKLVSSSHPLAVEQKKGISLDRVKEIAGLLLHPSGETKLPDGKVP